MTKLLCLFAFLLAGCSHYVTLHKQEPIARGEKSSLRAGLFFTESITKDSILDIDLGGEWNWTHYFHVQVGNEIAKAIQFSANASLEHLTVLDSLPNLAKVPDSLDFIIIPSLVSKKATIWISNSNKYVAASFYCKVRFDLTGQDGNILDSITINAFGVSDWKIDKQKNDTAKIIDSVVAAAADSALENLRSHVAYELLSNNSLNKLSRKPSLASIYQLKHLPQFYGKGETKLELDTTSYELDPLPNIRRWSIWAEEGYLFPSSEFMLSASESVDLMLNSRYSFKIGVGIISYFYHGLDSFVFTGTHFERVQSNDISKLDWILITRASYLFLGPKNFLEIGLGLNTELGKWFTGKITVPNQNRFQLLGIIGFRHQSIWYGSCFGASYIPYINTQGLQHSFALNFGFGF
jgi:hypothetical protein